MHNNILWQVCKRSDINHRFTGKPTTHRQYNIFYCCCLFLHRKVERHILYTWNIQYVYVASGDLGCGGGGGVIGVLPAANDGETETPVCKTRFAGAQSVGICRITVFVRSVGSGGGGGRGGRVEIKGKFYYRW